MMALSTKQIQISQIAVISSAITLLLFIWQGNVGFNLWDEGFLWYGSQRVVVGEVPIRDFMSYDPGRYYWSGAIMSMMNDNGIMALRLSVAIFQAMGLFTALILISKAYEKLSSSDFLFILVAALALIVWMFPRHKLFDISLSIFLIGLLTHLVERPEKSRFFLAGLGVGLIAFFGRNHGVYGSVGSIAIICYLSIKATHPISLIRSLSIW